MNKFVAQIDITYSYLNKQGYAHFQYVLANPVTYTLHSFVNKKIIKFRENLNPCIIWGRGNQKIIILCHLFPNHTSYFLKALKIQTLVLLLNSYALPLAIFLKHPDQNNCIIVAIQQKLLFKTKHTQKFKEAVIILMGISSLPAKQWKPTYLPKITIGFISSSLKHTLEFQFLSNSFLS